MPVAATVISLSDPGPLGAPVVELVELISDLRDELTRAVAAAACEGASIRTRASPVEVTVIVNKEAKPGAKVRFWVVEAGVDSSLSHTSTQKITLTLRPADSEGPAYVAGEASEDEE